MLVGHEEWNFKCLDACVIVCLLNFRPWGTDSLRFADGGPHCGGLWRSMGSNFEALGAPCLFLGVLWVAGLPRGAQNELIELPVQAGVRFRGVPGAGREGKLGSLWRPVAGCGTGVVALKRR